ncbi:MAG TPA: hypothetical protein VLA19_31580 [Herpetosiphonaceae bacterium]|nr:hypothetical protein [Herpetosiphonaceae bacterium]
MTVDNERGFDRGSRLTLGFVLVMFVVSATTAVLRLALVGDGCLLDAGTTEAQLFHACVGDWPTPLRAGDELIGIAGVRLEGSTEIRRPQAPPGWMDRGIAHYTVRRGGQTLDLAVPLQRMGSDEILRAFGAGLRRQAPDWNTLVFLGALVIFALAPRARGAQLLLVAVGGLTAVTALHWAGASVGADFVSTPLWYASAFLDTVWMWLFIPTLLTLVLSFPRRVWPLTRHPRLAVGLIFGLPLAATVITFITSNALVAIVTIALETLAVVVALVVVTADTFLRVRDPVIRAQTAWLAVGLAVGLVVWPLIFVLSILFPGLLPALEGLPRWAVVALLTPLTLAFPVCLGIAITRYRLFDIDVIIRRTLIYSVLTTTLALIFAGSVMVLQSLLRLLTGTAQNQLVTVASTLVIAALFQPLHRRVQVVVDRRFFRRKYDAQKTLAAFSTRLRDEVDLGQLSGELLAVVEETLQPRHVSLWLRETRPRQRERQLEER